VSSGAADNSFAVTELTMISEHCVAAAAAPVATVIPPSETVIAPVADAAAPSATASTPAADTAAPAATVNPSSATVSTPAVDTAAPAATVSPSSATVSTPAVDAAPPTRPSAHPRRAPTKQAPADTTPAATVSPSSETVSPPDAAAPTPAATHKTGSLALLIAFVVLVIVLGTLAPLLGRWRKRKMLQRTGSPNLSFTHEVSSDLDKPEPRKVA
jgi:hypothetical protein